MKSRSLIYDWGHVALPRNRSPYAPGPYSTAQMVAFGSYDAWLWSKWTYGLTRATSAVTSVLYDGYEEFNSSNAKRPHFNSCTHIRNTGKSIPFSLTYASSGKWVCEECSRYSLLSTKLPNQTMHYLDWTAASREAWWTMQPRFEGQVAMLNFLYELKDFKGLLSVLRSLVLKHYWVFIRALKRADPGKTLAEMHLANEFAIKPLLADIYEITCQLAATVRKAQQDFAAAGSGRESRHYSESSTLSSSVTPLVTHKYLATGSLSTEKYTATMEYCYKYTMRDTLDAFLRYWGLIPSAEVVWNMLPGSFILDYFATISRSISAMDVDANVDLDLYQYCESILTTVTSGYYARNAVLYKPIVVLDNKLVTVSGDYTHLCGAESSYYTRRVTVPNYGTVLPRARFASGKQMLNLAALVRCFL